MATIQRVYDKFCKTRFQLPSEDEVNALERKLLIRFPEEYRHFLLEFNGGFFSDAPIILPEPITVEWRDGLITHTQDGLTNMFGFHCTLPCAELGKRSDLSLFEKNEPLQLLPIGYTSLGSLLLLDLLPEYLGNILLKFPDEAAFTVAADIDDFFDLIDC